MAWDLSCPDWEDRLRTGRSLVPTLPLDQAAGDRAVAVFNKLRLADVPGNPTMAEAAGDWFRDLVRALFGSVDRVTRMRMIREAFLLVAKKNSKTTNGALLMVAALLLNVRPKASFIMTAPVLDVADLAFEAAAGAIKLDPVLAKTLHIRDHLKTITHRQTGATLEIMAFDPAVLTGQKPSGGVLIDELHVVAKMRKAPSAIRQLRGGMLPFPEAFLVFITTQSEEAPAGVFRAELLKARAIRDGLQSGPMLPLLYEFPEAMQKDRAQWADPRNWPMVVPNVGRSISIERLVEDMAVAEATGEEELRAWASQHLNVEIGLALHSDRWAGALFWEQQGRGITLDELLERSDVITVGIDGGGLDDLLGLAVIGRCKVTRNWLVWAHAWAHPTVLERRKSEAQRLRDFEADGDLTIVDQIGQDVDQVADTCSRIFASGLMDKIGVDPAGLGGILDALVEQEIPQDRVVGISQGWRMSGAIKTVERKLAEETIEHSGAPLMAWCVSNAKVVPVGNGVNITKQSSGTAKIDPLMAAFNAAELMSRNPAGANEAAFDDFIRRPLAVR